MGSVPHCHPVSTQGTTRGAGRALLTPGLHSGLFSRSLLGLGSPVGPLLSAAKSQFDLHGV